jgi:hypothetical protein
MTSAASAPVEAAPATIQVMLAVAMHIGHMLLASPSALPVFTYFHHDSM